MIVATAAQNLKPLTCRDSMYLHGTTKGNCFDDKQLDRNAERRAGRVQAGSRSSKRFGAKIALPGIFAATGEVRDRVAIAGATIRRTRTGGKQQRGRSDASRMDQSEIGRHQRG